MEIGADMEFERPRQGGLNRGQACERVDISRRPAAELQPASSKTATVERSCATVGRQLSHLYQVIPTNGFGSVKPGLVGLSIRCNVGDACGIRMAASRRAASQ